MFFGRRCEKRIGALKKSCVTWRWIFYFNKFPFPSCGSVKIMSICSVSTSARRRVFRFFFCESIISLLQRWKVTITTICIELGSTTWNSFGLDIPWKDGMLFKSIQMDVVVPFFSVMVELKSLRPKRAMQSFSPR